MTDKQRHFVVHYESENIPYIILGAEDECAINAILKYFEEVQTKGCDQRYINEINDKVNSFSKFRMENPGKIIIPK